VSDTLQAGLDTVDNGWRSSVPRGPRAELSLGTTISATLKFADGALVDLEMRTLDGRIPEWYAWFVPQMEFKYVGMSNSHRATFFQVGP
jgi:hypothetical protein